MIFLEIPTLRCVNDALHFLCTISSYYAFNLIMPCLMTLILILLGFTLSPDTCEKVGLQISVSLAICIFLALMNGMMPLTSEAVPLLG